MDKKVNYNKIAKDRDYEIEVIIDQYSQVIAEFEDKIVVLRAEQDALED